MSSDEDSVEMLKTIRGIDNNEKRGITLETF